MISTTIESHIADCLAHSVVYFARLDAPDGFDPINGGDAPAPTANESTAEMLRAYSNYLPQLMQVTRQEMLPMAQSELATAQAVSDPTAQLQTDLYAKYGPQLNQIGSDIARQNALAQAGTDLSVLTGPGKELAAAALEAQRMADPEYYAARAQAGQKLGDWMGALSTPTGELTPGERSEIERSLAQQNEAAGLGRVPTNLNTVSNAMQYGQGAMQKQAAQSNLFGQALQSAAQFLPASQSKVDVFQLTTGRPSTSNTGESKFTGVQQGTGDSALDFSQGIFGEIGQNQRTAMDINSKRRDSLDRVSQVMGSMPDVSCCWIFEFGGNVPWYVRASRDLFYTAERRNGYRRMSGWLVPLMSKFSIVRKLTRALMLQPLTEHGKAIWFGNKPTWFSTQMTKFWFSIWSNYGYNIS